MGRTPNGKGTARCPMPARSGIGIAPTIADARQLLKYAEDELEKAGGNLTAVRQAAEKGWLAAATAARRVIACATDEERPSSIGFVPRLEQIEKRYDPDAPLAATLDLLQGTLHGACYSRGDRELCGKVKSNLRVVARTIGDADKLCAKVSRKR